ncbi:MAG TPA: ice-binding family protein [Flavobacterium sp.]|jgi:hypothetical protein
MNKLLLLATTIALFACTTINAQAPVLGTARNFALFSTNGAVSSTGLSHVTGHVGTNNGSSTNFGNVDGVMHDQDGTTAIAAADLNTAYLQLDDAIPNFFPAPLLGNGQTLNAGTYAIGESASLNNTLILDGQGSSNAVFIFQIQGAFSSAAGSQVQLINGALACNVFWKIEGLVDLATNTWMKGTIVANNAAIILNSGVNLEGRALSTTGAVTVSNVTAVTPLGCGTPVLTGPQAPNLNEVACFTVFTGNGTVNNTGVSFVTGDIGSNSGLTTGYQDQNVDGTIHTNPDTTTAQAAVQLDNVYAYLSGLPVDIQLLYPAAFGSNLVLTPHTYLLNAATVLTGSIFLNAQDNVDAVFVLKIVGEFSSAPLASVVLQNGAQAKNVFWTVDGATNLQSNTSLKGTVIGNNGAVNLYTGVTVEGRVLSTSGGITTNAISAQMTPGCGTMATPDASQVATAQFYPNPFSNALNVAMEGFNSGVTELTIYNTLGILVMKVSLNADVTSIPVSLSSGIYYYRMVGDNGQQQAGKVISK